MNKSTDYIIEIYRLLCIKYRRILYNTQVWNLDTLLGIIYDTYYNSKYDIPCESFFVKETIDPTYRDGRNLQELLIELEILHQKLIDFGITINEAMKMLPSGYNLSTLVIKKDGVIFFPDYNKSIILTPMQSALYVLLLEHSEGINVKELSNYHDELENKLSNILHARGKNVNPQRIEKAIDRIINVTSGAVNENISRIKHAFTDVLIDNRIARNYYINSLRLHKMRIPLDRQMVKFII